MDQLDEQYIEAHIAYVEECIRRHLANPGTRAWPDYAAGDRSAVDAAYKALVAAHPGIGKTPKIEWLLETAQSRIDAQTLELVAKGALETSPEILMRVGAGRTLEDLEYNPKFGI